MLRQKRSSESGDFDGFRLRGQEITRLESFSDAVFGFALTLLVVSLDVPKTFSDLVTTMRGFPAFALCFLFLALIWNGHYKYCRRTGWTTALLASLPVSCFSSFSFTFIRSNSFSTSA